MDDTTTKLPVLFSLFQLQQWSQEAGKVVSQYLSSPEIKQSKRKIKEETVSRNEGDSAGCYVEFSILQEKKNNSRLN
jgi:hypothetical protein